ncbi:MAG: hypothetical protein WD529_00515 [Balneolaceae bacterium]
MRTNTLFAALLLITLYPFVTKAQNSADADTVTFQIHSENIETMRALYDDRVDAHYVGVQLNPDWIEVYSELTENSIGDILNITFQESVLASSLVRFQNEHGRLLLGPYKNQDAVREEINRIIYYNRSHQE